jgi:hypothetical protein
MQFFRSRTIEAGVQVETDTDSARLLRELVYQAAATNPTYKSLDGLARSLGLTLQHPKEIKP